MKTTSVTTFLNDLELEAREVGVAEAICRHGQSVFEQRNRPRDDDRLPERPSWPYFRCPYQADVMKTFNMHRRITVVIALAPEFALRWFPA
jgi:hypothetical protein